MFQFPGFAFINLCIQSINTWFTSLLIALAGNNNKVSGGLPHSEIHGSKHILSSPWLIAEYHVFHRLLLPRHSPNALFALDLIQKKKDLRQSRLQKLVRNCRPYSGSKAYFSRLRPCGRRQWFKPYGSNLVSVLDLDNMFVSASIRMGARGNRHVKRLPQPEGIGTKLRFLPLLGETKQC
jgi:hypothetical protein